MSRLLLVDDEPAIQHAFRRAFRNDSIELLLASNAAEAMDLVVNQRPDVVVLDIHLPDSSGLDTFLRIRASDARIPVILVTGHGTTELAIEAIKEGAFEYLLKPLELSQLRQQIDLALHSSRLMRVPAAIAGDDLPQSATSDPLIGRCPAMQEVYKAIGRVARQDVTVLIRGESGTGKELVARALYQHSRRAHKPFLAVNCASIPDTLLESELFGHERGAFTSADRKRVGKFEQCKDGTIFLDEVGELSLVAQAKILRLIQEQQFERVGGEETLHTDVRLIAATNADLERLVREGRFRKDLYFRLNVFSIDLPPLRERGDDLDLLATHYARVFALEFGKDVQAISPEALAALRAAPWPGNVRELQSIVKQAVLNQHGPELLPQSLHPRLRDSNDPLDTALPWTEAPADPPNPDNQLWAQFVQNRCAAGTTALYAEALEHMEREVLGRVLRQTAGNQVQAARLLGITRGSLRHKMRSLGITVKPNVATSEDPDPPGSPTPPSPASRH